ncbi:hypothetical protein BDQ94DRAFT_139011 [Aspergillus welwitschiae]|uniref:Uncharacterized protein n=1 Tax=Aspergillus welwitschiae TaxID=1341132 RepID=A0A3F3Q951_9EURO|nr:hypothetical protein BDQ94DRAFT_139011 [Aspergillus welwitschiae]RDH35683.1 hypothetical protein BDQ94DRAFT_139011 [Aspergillus welwitschiae]
MTARDCDSWEVFYDIPYSVQSNSSYSRISLRLRVDIHVLIWYARDLCLGLTFS